MLSRQIIPGGRAQDSLGAPWAWVRDWCGFGEKGAAAVEERRGGREEEGKKEREVYW